MQPGEGKKQVQYQQGLRQDSHPSLVYDAVTTILLSVVSICSVTKYFQGQGASYILGQFIFRLLECFFISAKIYFLAEFTPLS